MAVVDLIQLFGGGQQLLVQQFRGLPQIRQPGRIAFQAGRLHLRGIDLDPIRHLNDGHALLIRIGDVLRRRHQRVRHTDPVGLERFQSRLHLPALAEIGVGGVGVHIGQPGADLLGGDDARHRIFADGLHDLGRRGQSPLHDHPEQESQQADGAGIELESARRRGDMRPKSFPGRVAGRRGQYGPCGGDHGFSIPASGAVSDRVQQPSVIWSPGCTGVRTPGLTSTSFR